MNKVFVIGLPRTGTTSLCAALLKMNFKVAHTAYTQQSFFLADVIADTPVYCDFPFLDRQFPSSKFIYLDRDILPWSASMQNLLIKLGDKIVRKNRGYHPLLFQCLQQVFGFDGSGSLPTLSALEQSYMNHKNRVLRYFSGRAKDLLILELESPNAYRYLCDFLARVDDGEGFDHLNVNGQVFDWDRLKHPLKVGSHERDATGRKYFDFGR